MYATIMDGVAALYLQRQLSPQGPSYRFSLANFLSARPLLLGTGLTYYAYICARPKGGVIDHDGWKALSAYGF